MKLSSDGGSLVYSTYIGGSNDEEAYGIALDGSGNACITGFTHSRDYDVTSGAYQTYKNQTDRDVFFTKLNTTGTALVYSTFLGGRYADEGYAIAVDASGSAYITGSTQSDNFPTTLMAYQRTIRGSSDVFVAKFSSNGSLLYSTYIGGAMGKNIGYAIAVDRNGNAYITGQTTSTEYPTTPGAYQPDRSYSFFTNADAFVTKLNANGTALVYSTYLGGRGGEEGRGIGIDASGNAYVTGWTNSSDYDTTAGAFQTVSNGGYDAFLTKLNPTGTGLIYSTYLGGRYSDQAYGLVLDPGGNPYIVGQTDSDDFPVTNDAWQPTRGWGYDGFIAKFGLGSGAAALEGGHRVSFSVYPNPARGSFWVEVEEGGAFELVDAVGRVIGVYAVGRGGGEISVSLPAGLYFLRERKSGAVQKLIIE
uniref:Hypothetical conserved protein n=1 Tax=uncultured Bacteroidota bacterium TaxID=152509 RepID=H5SIE6_9BACT|nr:hypothetical conserved protein [uncultured Bacteroidetes bacterium]